MKYTCISKTLVPGLDLYSRLSILLKYPHIKQMNLYLALTYIFDVKFDTLHYCQILST